MTTLQKRFLEYCALGRPGAQDLTHENFDKMFKDKGIIDKNLRSTDMIFMRASGKTTHFGRLTFDTFQEALKMTVTSKFGLFDQAANLERLKAQIVEGDGPGTSGTTTDHFGCHKSWRK